MGACGAVTPAPMRTPESESGPVRVRFTSPTPAELSVARGAPGPGTICASPCEREIEVRGRTFVARSPLYDDSPTFAIPPLAKGVKVELSPSSLGNSVGLGLMAVPGATVGLLGGTFALLDASGRDDFEGATLPGAILALTGAHLLAGGLVVWAFAGSDVSISEGIARAASGVAF